MKSDLYNIHDVINIKGDLEYIDNILKSMDQDRSTPFNLTSLVMKGQELYNIEVTSGEYMCGECSSQAGRPIYHIKKPVFNEFRNKPFIKRYAKQLQEIAQRIY